MHRLLSLAFTQNTHKTYSTGWNAFIKYMAEQNLVCAFPVSVHVIRQFVGWLSLRGLAPNTISTYVAGIGHQHKLMGFTDPTADYLVSKLLEGCRRDRGVADGRRPITVPILSLILRSAPFISSSRYEVALFRSAFLCAFFGFMRVGEFAAHSRGRVQDSVLRFSDVRICQSGDSQYAQISFRASKTNQAGAPQVIRLIPSRDAFLCPVSALKEFLQARPIGPTVLFCHFDGSPLTRHQFNAVLRKALEFSDLGGHNFKSHSFRIGAATVAHNEGIPTAQIKEMGRWRSDVALSYIRPVATCSIPGTSVNHDKLL